MAGKTSVGKELAKILGYDFADTDEMIVKKEGKEISEIFSENGEKYFREIESDIAGVVSVFENTVISTGGGMVLKKENILKLRKNGVIVNLEITDEVIKKRLKKEHENRPLIKDSDFESVLKKFETRKQFYDNCDYKIIISVEKGIKEHAEEIIDLLKRNGEI